MRDFSEGDVEFLYAMKLVSTKGYRKHFTSRHYFTKITIHSSNSLKVLNNIHPSIIQ